MNADVEFHIRHNYPWTKLPANVKQVSTSPEYDSSVNNFGCHQTSKGEGTCLHYLVL